ncbi:MAG: cyanophycinase [Gemmataceae bacterium]|nr:cyanophycinase [Gemmataceae bacterium]
MTAFVALVAVLTPPAAAPPPRVAVPPVAELPGPLVIVGGGGMPDGLRERFVELAGGPKARTVVVPTASEYADDPKEHDGYLKPWRDLGPASVVLLHTRDRATADDPAFVKPLLDATGVWFSGGDQSRITAAYAGTLTGEEFHKLHARGGVLGGTSAGAAVMSDLMITGGTDRATTAAGLGFLPGFVVDQHFTARNRQNRLRGVIAGHPARVGLGIDEATAVVARGRTLRVVGAGAATVVLAAGAGKPELMQATKAGGTLDLFQLRRAALNRGAKEPFPPAKPREPVLEKGSLVIVGGGRMGGDLWRRFLDLAGGPDAPIVVIPTALEDPLPETPGEVAALRRLGAKNVKVLHTRNRAEADDPAFSEMLLTAKGVWFGGGRQWRFVDTYAGTLTEKRIHAVLARGGVIGGSSAGASIQGEYLPRGHPLGNTVMAAEGYERGFAFLPGVAIDQHFFARKRTADMTGLMKQYPQFLGIGIDEGTAVVVTGPTAEVIGESKAAFYDYWGGPPAGEVDYVEVKAGGRYDLRKRMKAE